MAPIFSGAEPFLHFGRRHHEEQFCRIIMNLDLWSRRCHLKIFSIALDTLLFSGVEQFVQFW